MDYTKCPSCGKDTPAVLSRCKHCGAQVIKPYLSEQPRVLKDRSGFVTFWLWFGVITNSIFTISFFIQQFSSVGVWSATPEPFFIRIILFLFSFLFTVGYILLLRWYKPGYYLLVGLGIIEFIAALLVGISMKLALAFIIAPLFLLYLVLQCRKNGKSCWQLLENYIPGKDEVKQSNVNGFVSFWLYSGAVSCLFSILVLGYLLYLTLTNQIIFIPGMSIPIEILFIAISVGELVGYSLLIKGIKIGFYLIAFLVLLACAYISIEGNFDPWLWVLCRSGGLVILFAVLQIRKNGKSCWELLS